MFIKKNSYKTTILLFSMILSVLLLGSLYSINYSYKTDNQLLETLKVNHQEEEIHRGLYDEFTKIYNNIQYIISAKNSSEDNLRTNLIDNSISAIKKNRDICIHNGTVLHVDDEQNSFKNQGEDLIAFFKLQKKILNYKLQGNNNEVNNLNKELKARGLKLINKTLKQGSAIVNKENKLKLNRLTENNKKKFQLGILISALFFILSGLILFLFIRKYKKHNDTLKNIALKDNLTGICNRTSFVNKMNEYVQIRYEKEFSIVFFDIDNFKKINTKHGHHIGNEALLSFTERLLNFFKGKDIIFARFGGDEFVLLIKNVNYQQNRQILKRLSKYLKYNFLTSTTTIQMSASIGCSHYPTDGMEAEMLLKKSDEAVLYAKRLGKNTYKEYDDSMDSERKYEEEMSHQLHTSIIKQDDSLSLVYQPIMTIQDNDNIQECEVLLRWKDNEGKSIPAQEFITIAEKSTLIDDINLYVIDKVCLQQKKWKEANKTNNKKEIRTSINISGEADVVINLLDRLSSNIERDNLKPSLFGIEITERTLFDMSEGILNKLTKLRDMGMKISLDDFGIGYSSLFYLRKIPLTTVKIDKVFVDDISCNKRDTTIVKSVINLSHSLGFTVVAEGVESQDQLNLLKGYCCDYVQGYLYSKPVSNKEMLALAN